MALQPRTEKAVCVGGCERGSQKEGAARVGRCLPAAVGKGAAAPLPCPQLWEGLDLTQQLSRSLRTPGWPAHLVSPDLGVWRFEKTFFGHSVALPASDLINLIKIFGVSG